MRIPVPERFNTKYVILFATFVFVVQQLERTNLTFSILTATYICLFAAAYRAGRGIFYPSGAFIFFNGTLSAIIGIVYKLFINEPGESNLLAANTTMAAYCIGMAGMGVAAYCSHRLIPKRGLLAGMAAGETMQRAAIGCVVLGVLIQLTSSGNVANGSFASGIRQLNQFLQMSILLGTTYVILKTRGQRSVNWVVWFSGLWLLFFGVIVYSKSGIFISVETWMIAAIALRYNFSRTQLISILLGTLYAFYYLVPFSQYGRTQGDETLGFRANTALVFGMLTSPIETRRLYLQAQETAPYLDLPHFFNEPQGIFDRLQMLAFDDSLIAYTDQGNVIGLLPTYQSFANVVPRFLWPGKPNYSFGNQYAHELGVLADEDETTGISFSAVGDGYHQARWWGVAVLLPLILFMLFFVTDSLTGDIRKSPWGLLPVAVMSHAAPEGLLGGAVYLTFYGSLGLIFTALLAKYVLPLIGSLAFGGDRPYERRMLNFRPVVSARTAPRTTDTSENATP